MSTAERGERLERKVRRCCRLLVQALQVNAI